MKFEVDVDEHHAVGPFNGLYDHDAVTVISRDDEDNDRAGAPAYSLFVCLDCGFVSHDSRLFAHEECDPAKNGINVSWRDRLGDALDGGDDQ